MIRPAIALALLLAFVGCARSKSETAPSASSSTTPASAGASAEGGGARIKLCSDGLHKPGDHWKEACNPCRCAADGDITCAHFPCGQAGAANAEAGTKADAGGAAP
jgi:hypothetical protein